MSIAVSVLVATYKREMELKKALISLSEQTFTHFEIILVDDNGNKEWNDKVQAIVDGFKLESSIQLRLIVNNVNLGSAKARNRGIEEARGEYITFLDDDDLYLPDKLKHQYEECKKFDADYSLTDIALYNENDSIIEIRKRMYLNSPEKNNLLVCHLKYHMTGSDTMMFKRSYLKQIGSFDPIDVGDEFYLMMKAIRGGGTFLYVPVCDVKAYVHFGNGGLSSGQRKIEGENTLYKFKKQFFTELSKKDIRYLRMRHYAVLSFAYLRNKKYLECFMNAFISITLHPIGAMSLVINRKKI